MTICLCVFACKFLKHIKTKSRSQNSNHTIITFDRSSILQFILELLRPNDMTITIPVCPNGIIRLKGIDLTFKSLNHKIYYYWMIVMGFLMVMVMITTTMTMTTTTTKNKKKVPIKKYKYFTTQLSRHLMFLLWYWC